MEVEFPYKREESEVFNGIRRPRIKIEIHSEKTDSWEVIDEVLADTGADFCVLPRSIGNILVKDISEGKYLEIKGIAPRIKLIAWMHELKVKLNGEKFATPVALADSDDVPCIFGRVNALDLFNSEFTKGKKLKLSK